MQKETSLPAQGVVPLPSADLIKYRFDLIDEKFAHLDQKLDKITTTFFTKEEAMALRQEWTLRIKDTEEKLANYQWYWRAVVTATLLALASSLFALFTKAKL